MLLPSFCEQRFRLFRPLASLTVLQPPGGELCHEGPLHLGQRQIPDPRLEMQFMQQAGVCGPGMQFILFQEILPPLCPGEH